MSRYRSPVVVGVREAPAVPAPGAITVARAVPGEVSLDVARPAEVTVTLVSLSGASRVVARKHLQPGTRRLDWDAADLAPGVHFLRIEAAGSGSLRAITALQPESRLPASGEIANFPGPC